MQYQIHRQVLSLLANRCQAYHDWEVAFRSVLIASKNPKAASDFFQKNTQDVAHKISSVSITLRNEILPKLAEDENNNKNTGTYLTNYIELIQSNEKVKFESTIALQKLVMGHMRGSNCAEFVHELNCAVYNFCFGFMGGTALAGVTAAASTAVRRRIEGGDETGEKEEIANSNQKNNNTIPVSDDDGDEEDDGGKNKEQEKIGEKKAVVAEDTCVVSSATLLHLLNKIKQAEEVISDTTQEIQAMIDD